MRSEILGVPLAAIGIIIAMAVVNNLVFYLFIPDKTASTVNRIEQGVNQLLIIPTDVPIATPEATLIPSPTVYKVQQFKRASGSGQAR